MESDAELLRRHVNGDPDAFGELFLRHKDRLWAVAIRTLGDPEDAADALQDAMISAFRRADSFRGDSAVTTWLHRIVVNACLDKMRRRSARPEVGASDDHLLDAAAGEASVDPATGSDVSLEVMAALRQLPRDQQVALVLVDMLDYPVADAAQVLGVAEGTVKSRCARGRARLLPNSLIFASPPRTRPPAKGTDSAPDPSYLRRRGVTKRVERSYQCRRTGWLPCRSGECGPGVEDIYASGWLCPMHWC